MNDAIGTLLLALYLVGGLFFLLLRVLLLDMRMWIALAVFLAWVFLRGRRETGLALLLATGVALVVHGVNASGGAELCPGWGYLDPADKVRLWRAAVMQQLTGEPRAPWCDEDGGRRDCPWLRRWRGPAAPEAQLALVREAFRLLEVCARERGDFHRCRQLLREDGRDACKALDCAPHGLPVRPWLYTNSLIRAVIFSRDPEGMDVDFRIYVNDALKVPFLHPEAPGYARAFAAKLHLYQDTLTGNHCPAAKVTLTLPRQKPLP